MNKQILLILFVLAAGLLRGQTPTASFANWRDNAKGAYSIVHDDYSDYVPGIFNYGDTIAFNRGIKLCFGAITNFCGATEWANARTMISHGHECINHTHNHLCGGTASQCSGLSTYGSAQFSTELGLSSSLIETNTGVKPLFFIHPYDATSAAIETYLTGLGYIGARAGTQEAINTSSFTDFMHLNFHVWSPTSNITTLNAAVDAAIAGGGYAMREFHGIEDGSWAAMTVPNYRAHLNYVKDKMNTGDLWSATASEAITYKMQRDAYQSTVTYNATTGQVNVNFSLIPGKTINTAILKTPVTVNVDLKTISSTNVYTVFQGSTQKTFTRSGNIITFNVYPHEGNVVLNCTNCAPPAPLVGPITQPTCTTATGSVVLNGLPSTGTWTINPGNISGQGTSYTVTGLLANATYNFTVADAGGHTSPPSANVVINAQPITPPPPSVGTIHQPTCTVVTGDVTLTGLPSGNWTINPGGITGTGSSKQITGLTAGTYNYSVTNAAGCTSTMSANIVIDPQPVTPSAPFLEGLTQPTCSVPTGTIILGGLPASGSWTLNPGGITGTGESKTLEGLNPGVYSYTVTNSAGCTSLSSGAINLKTVTGAPTTPTIGTITHPICASVLGTVVLNGLPSGNWLINPGNISGSGVTTTISGLSPGIYNFTVKDVDGSGCLSPYTANIVINGIPNPPVLTSPTVLHPGCPSPLAGTITVNATTTTGTLEYSINGGTSYQSSATFNGLTAGTYSIVVRIVGSTCTTTGSTVTINAAPVAPIVSESTVTQPNCPSPATGTIVVNATTTIGTLEYSIDGGVTYRASATFNGLSAGTYNIVVRRVGTLCTATGNPVIILPAPPPPSVSGATVTQPNCPSPAKGIIVINATTTIGTLEYSIDGGTNYQTSATFSDLNTGTYNIVVRRVGTLCTTTGNPVTINPAPPVPIVSAPTVIQPDCPSPTAGTIIVNATTSVGTLEYSIDGGTSYQTSATFNGLSAGTYNIVVRRVGTICITTGSSVTILPAPLAPSVSESTVTQPNCPSPATGTIVINATTTIGTLEYSVDGGTSYHASATFSDLNAGTYNIVVRRVGTLCTTTGNPVTINPAPPAPIVNDPTVTQPDCPSPATGTIIVNASTTVGTLEYSIDGGTNYQASAIFSGLNAGTYNIVVRRVGTICTKTGSTVTLLPVPPTPIVSASTVTQPDCPSPTGGTIVVNATTTVGTLEYSIDGGTSYHASTTFSNLNAGTYNIVVRRIGTLCTATGSPVTIIAAPIAPSISASTVTQPDCPSPATGTIVVNATTTIGTLEYSINGGTSYQTSATFSGLNAGTYNVVVRRVGTLCTKTGEPVTILPVPPTPIVSAPTVTQPDCSSPVAGTIVVNATTTVGTLEYSIDGGTSYQPSATFSGLNAGTYNIVVRRIGTICLTTGSTVTINPAPPAPIVSAPTVTQPNCPSPSTGTIVVNATTTVGTLEYSIDGGTSYQASATFSGLSVGTYNIVVRRVGTICTTTGNTVTINPAPLTPSVSAPIVTQPGCPSPTTGTIVVNATGIGTLEYSIDGGTSYQTSSTFAGLNVGSYTISVRVVGTTCATTGSTVTINPVPPTPIVNSPTVTQPDCPSPTGGTIVVNASTTVGTLEYSVDGGTSYQTSAIFSGLSAGTYNIVVRRVGTLCITTGSTVTINPAPLAPSVSAPTVTQLGCPNPTTATIVVNATTTIGTLEYSINGGTSYQTSATFSGLNAGTYNIVVRRVGTLCTTTGSTVTIDPTPLAPSVSAPTVTQPGCPSPLAGIIIVNATTATGTLEYSINGGVSYQASATFNDLGAGSYTIAVRRVGTLCITIGSTVTIDPAPIRPVVTASTVTQPACPSPSTGTIVVNATIATGTLEYSINGGTSYQNTPTFSGLSAGTYAIVVRVIGTLCTTTGSAVTINPIPDAPNTPSVVIVQPTCTVALGNVSFSGLPASGTWTLNPGNITGTGTTTSITGLSAGSYNYTVTNVAGCTSAPVNVVINPQPSTPVVPTVSNVTQPTCNLTTGSVEFSGLPASGSWTIMPGNVTGTGTTTTLSGLAAGTYNFTVTNAAGCTSPATASVVLTAATGCCTGSLPPTVTLTSPANGGVAATNMVLSATASDADGTISHVNFYWVAGITKTGVISRILLNRDNSEPYTYTWANIVGGNYNVQAEAVDNCGKSTFSTMSNVNILETFTVVITSPTNGQSVVPGSNLEIAASVIPYSSRTVSKVEFYVGNTKLGEDLTAPYTYLWTSVPSGNFTLTAKAIDNTGASWSSPLYFITGINSLNRTQRNQGNNNNQELTMTASPNPANNQVVLNTNIALEGDYTLSLTDLVGQVVVSKKVNYGKGTNTEVLDISTFPKGIYIVRLVPKDGTESVAQKLIID